MGAKANKLQQAFENLQLFLQRSDCISTTEQHTNRFQEIITKTESLQSNLNEKKLICQIVSQKQSLAQACFDLINNEPLLKEFYHLKLAPLPSSQNLELTKSASLQLKQNHVQETECDRSYQLCSDRQNIIGRAPESEIALNSNLYQGVSWHHAIIQSIETSTTQVQWQICDRKSTNGTFVNGEPVSECRVLQPNDVITLAYPKTRTKIATFIFDLNLPRLNTEVERNYWELVDCDLLFLVIDHQQPLSIKEQEFIKNLAQSSIYKLFLVVNITVKENQTQTNLKQLEEWLQNQAFNFNSELILLPLESNFNNSSNQNSNLQIEQQKQFLKNITNLVKRQPENILANRLAVKFINLIKPIELILEQQHQEVSQQIIQKSQQVEMLGQSSIKENYKKAIAQINLDKDKFFKQTKFDLSQAKAVFLDNFSKRSIIYQIESFIDELATTIVSRNGHKYICLIDHSNSRSNNPSYNLINFCITSLQEWSAGEWDKICHLYGKGGLNHLLAEAYTTINFIPGLLKETPFLKPQTINMGKIFLNSFTETTCEVIYKQNSLGAYIMKQIRSQLMQIMMMVTLVLSLIDIQTNKGVLMGELAKIFKQFPWLFGLVVCGVFFLLINAYDRDNEMKIKEAEKKLKKDLASYYQSFAKNLLEQVVQDLNIVLEAEDKKISNALELVNQTYNKYLFEQEKQQIKLNQELAQYKTEQNNLAQALAEFNKLMKL